MQMKAECVGALFFALRDRFSPQHNPSEERACLRIIAHSTLKEFIVVPITLFMLVKTRMTAWHFERDAPNRENIEYVARKALCSMASHTVSHS